MAENRDRRSHDTEPPEDSILRPTVRAPAEDDALNELTRHISQSLDQSSRSGDSSELPCGRQLGDFELLELLGRGAIATVYLARQISLGRLVALKVATGQEQEARALAILEHESIVRIFSQAEEGGLQIICMQFIPGVTLETIIHELQAHPRGKWCGKLILQLIEENSTHSPVLSSSGLRDRDHLLRSNHLEAACWIGSRLAEALAHAHSQGVLHRDIKPANILLNGYGRPYLSDFNMALARREDGTRSLGGTLRYMAPEHLDAFNPATEVSEEAVDERSDIYSLGLVLYELLRGELDAEQGGPYSHPREQLTAMAAHRRAHIPSLRDHDKTVPFALDHVLQRCLAPSPRQRFQSATEMVEALNGAQELSVMQESARSDQWLARLCRQRPILLALLLIMGPHLLGSVVNISYNSVRIVGTLSPAQQEAFQRIVFWYNITIYPICVIWGVSLLVRILIPVRMLTIGTGKISITKTNEARRNALRFPAQLTMISCLGWIPGGLLFPWFIQIESGPVSATVYQHFLLSFTISGLIASTYGYLSAHFMVAHVCYPVLWMDPIKARTIAREELRGFSGRFHLIQTAAGLIPLMGAVLLLGYEQDLTIGFRLLIIELIGLGMLGFGLALRISAHLNRTYQAMMGERGS